MLISTEKQYIIKVAVRKCGNAKATVEVAFGGWDLL
jgi:hypothetical protein